VDQDVYGDDFTDETFRVKEKEIMQYGDGYAVGRDGWYWGSGIKCKDDG
jgi:hypothetical protein